MRSKIVKVFISWSGDISLKVATVFRDWLPSVIQSIEPYVSSEDIDKGARWSTDIAKELENSTFGILCVTKENIEAPWLSFEAGALSKTMEKSFVSPFLFDIKRSEVQGPILQFQSTIFEKKDIKKLINTLNKACGESGISDARLEKAFEVWYPTLEKELSELKSKNIENSDTSIPEENNNSSEILEEILELSRDNQKLLRNPDDKLYDDINEIKSLIEEIRLKNSLNEKRRTKKYSPMFLDEIIHENIGRDNMPYGFLIVLSCYKEEFPWIYDSGKELLDLIKSDKSNEEKIRSMKTFREIVDYTCSHPIMRDMFLRNKDSAIMLKEMPFALMKCLDELERIYI